MKFLAELRIDPLNHPTFNYRKAGECCNLCENIGKKFHKCIVMRKWLSFWKTERVSIPFCSHPFVFDPIFAMEKLLLLKE